MGNRLCSVKDEELEEPEVRSLILNNMHTYRILRFFSSSFSSYFVLKRVAYL